LAGDEPDSRVSHAANVHEAAQLPSPRDCDAYRFTEGSDFRGVRLQRGQTPIGSDPYRV
jgi:hypothetical protein